MRRLGRFTITLIIIVGLLVAADLGVTSYAESQTASRLAQDFDAQATVDFVGWPVAARMLAGTIPQALVNLRGLDLENGATLDRLDVELIDVEVSMEQLNQSSERLPPAREGTFEAELSEESVAALMGVPGVVQVRLVDGVVRMSAVGIDVDAEVEATDGGVSFGLEGPIAELLGAGQYTIDLSEEPGAPSVDEVEITDGVMLVRGTLQDVER